MARHAQPEPKRNGKLKWILLAAVIVTALAAAGIFLYFRFIAQPSVDPPPYQAPAETAASEEAETQAPAESLSAIVDAYIESMSEREKLCQLFIVTPEVLTGVDGVTLAGEQTKSSLESYPVGGIVYFADNLIDGDQTRTMIANSQSYSRTPLFIAVDEEGGIVARCAERLGTTALENMFTYRSQGTATAYENAKTIASDIRGFGFNLDFAPVADVWTNPENTVIAERAYSDSYEEAAELVASAVRGFNENGVTATLKHFPGHGDTYEDSHDGLAYLAKTAEELKSGELLPFKSGIEAGAGMVMIGHLVVEDMDAEKPATLSPVVVPTLLRQELGYDGVTVTDSMSMGAILENYGYDEIVKGFFDADIDMILCPDDLDSYLDAMENALSDGSITMAQIDAKLRRIITLKFERRLLVSMLI